MRLALSCILGDLALENSDLFLRFKVGCVGCVELVLGGLELLKRVGVLTGNGLHSSSESELLS